MEIIVDNVQRLVDAEMHTVNSPGTQRIDWFLEYHQIEDIYDWLRQLAEKHADILRVTAPGDLSKRKRIWLESMVHAREWISGITLQYIINSLVGGYSRGEQRIKTLLEKAVFVFVPVCNPDGCLYGWRTDRMWRKNCEHTVSGKAYGVDLNRNWPDHWASDGSSNDPGAEDFHGPSAGSSREVQALMAAYIKEPNVVGAIDFHAYSQLILSPYGWTNAASPDDAAYERIGQQIADDIYRQSGKNYTFQRSISLYPTSGTVSDWWYGPAVEAKIKAGIPGPRPYSFAMELRPN
ncbi:hypothetical protein THASP1DRAFT_22773 [Thamnocephalis sphaerospora]|uniref:Peptidase M14 domain-containing protein n=1 Tax=Thamnocephalis sphaerospora TaxID=78915 RepID=A0A4P9XT88_9FUNG|nr:hypothetical protein THASP1DRAFT_22773 [Thamnocephalis sphaerospora]|eukprot:RKP09378.1 hypothetical protein THASP1DRAFT_22773 [Thamnocephalis sphaerospora]